MGTPVLTADAWTLNVEDALGAAGHRRSAARSEVIALLSGRPGPLSAHEIERRLASGERAVGRTTVYRALELLVEHGHVRRLEVGDGTARYEAVLDADRYSVRLVCGLCDSLLRFDDEAWRDAIDELADRLGCDINGYDIVLRGRCRSCSPGNVCERCT